MPSSRLECMYMGFFHSVSVHEATWRSRNKRKIYINLMEMINLHCRFKIQSVNLHFHTIHLDAGRWEFTRVYGNFENGYDDSPWSITTHYASINHTHVNVDHVSPIFYTIGDNDYTTVDNEIYKAQLLCMWWSSIIPKWIQFLWKRKKRIFFSFLLF